MTSPENPFDKTIWDPIDPEQAIEDPFHGSEAVAGLLSIPPYKNEDGTYYVFGASHISGTCTFDNEGRPFIKFKTSRIAADLREQEEHRKWIEAYQAGDLLPVDEMGLPTFLFNDPPYFVLEKQTGQNIPMKGKLFGGEPDKPDMK